MIDLWSSRRDMFIKCEYWSQDRSELDQYSNSKVVYNSVPTGFFYAKEVNSYSTSNQVIAESYMVEENSITIMTRDDVSNLKRNDIIRFEETIYRVDSIEKEPIKKQRNYMSSGLSFTYYISLRR